MSYDLYRQCPSTHYPYIIQPGDTLNAIASRLETSVPAIMAANPGVNPYNLRIGQSLCIPACPPNHVPRVIQAGDTLYNLAQAYGVTVASILRANPSVQPNYLRVGQRLCIPAPCPANYSEVAAAMQMDINALKAESDVQQVHESNYGNSVQRTRVLRLTERELQFDAAPAIFAGNYQGHYTEGDSYPYYLDAAMGGQRGLNVKDNFGIWHTFVYRVTLPQ